MAVSDYFWMWINGIEKKLKIAHSIIIFIIIRYGSIVVIKLKRHSICSFEGAPILGKRSGSKTRLGTLNSASTVRDQTSGALGTAVLGRGGLAGAGWLNLAVLGSGSIPGPGSGRLGLLRVSAVGSGVVLVAWRGWDWGNLRFGWNVGDRHGLQGSVERIPDGEKQSRLSLHFFTTLE